MNLDPGREAKDVPLVLEVDAIWVTLLRVNGEVGRDRKGRKRLLRGRFKVPITIAMGVWPDSGRREILCHIVVDEGAEEWVTFLEILNEQGIRCDNGLKLIIHVSGKGSVPPLRSWCGSDDIKGSAAIE